MVDLGGKTAVVTGGSRGIGRAIVERLARDGARVVFSFNESVAAADEVGKTAVGSRAVQVDLAAPDAVTRLFEGVEELDILVCNAATVIAPTALAEVTESDYDRVMAVNTRSVFFALQHAARHMRDNGRIVLISSLNTTMAGLGASLYGGSKGAIEQFGKALARELGPRGITVNSVSPGLTDTDMLRDNNAPEALAAAVPLTPLGRMGQPSDIADVVASWQARTPAGLRATTSTQAAA